LPPGNRLVYASASARSCPHLFDSAQDSGAKAVPQTALATCRSAVVLRHHLHDGRSTSRRAGALTSVQQMAVRQRPGDPVLQLLQVPSGDQLDLPRSPCSARRRTSSKCSRWIEITRSTRPFVEASPYAATNSSSRLSRSGGLLKRCQRIAGGVVAERAPRTRTRTRRHQAGRRAGRTRSQADPPVWSRLTRCSTGPSRRGKPTDLGRRCRSSRRITPDLSRGRQPTTG
jgi:hypothetical protein